MAEIENENSLVRTFSHESEFRHVTHQHLTAKSFFDRLKEHKDNKRYCDVKLKIKGDNQNIHAHKIVLASFSDYFAAMFNPDSSMIERELAQIELELPGFAFDIFDIIIDYAYSGEITITCENVQDLTTGARFFDVPLLLDECGRFMEGNIQGENCLGMLAFADTNNLQSLREAAMNFAQRNFEDVYTSPELVFLHPRTIEDLLNSGTLLIKHGFTTSGEKLVLDMVLTYLQKKNSLNAQDVSAILSQVRLPYLKESTLNSLKNIKLLQEIPRCIELIEAALKFQNKETEVPMVKNWDEKRLFSEIRYTSYPPLASGGYLGSHEQLAFNDETWIQDGKQITGIKMWIRRWDGRGVLGGLEVFYDGIGTGVHGSNDGELCRFTLLPGEFITSTDICSGWLIDSLTFMTNKGNTYGPYGGNGGGQRKQNPAEALKLKQTQVRLTFFKGSTVPTQGSLAIINLSSFWAYEAKANTAEIPVITNQLLDDDVISIGYSDVTDEDDHDIDNMLMLEGY